MSRESTRIQWSVDGVEFEGYATWKSEGASKRPLVLVHHAWAGQGDLERRRADELADLGYVAVAMDVYGKGKYGNSTEECQALMTPLVSDRSLLQKRLLAGLEAAKGLENADASRVAAVGYCFGGLSVLDIARSGVELSGVISFHGLFMPNGLEAKPVKCKVLALHGFDDPMADPEAMVGFCKEMTGAGADWQLHAYGNTKHAFTNPAANDEELGTIYDEKAEARSMLAMRNFLEELFA